MNLLDAAAVFAAGVAAGGINTVVGSGSLITFPTLVALGYPPVVANISNNIGLVPGGVTGAYGYRNELTGQRGRLLRLGSGSLIGAVIGGLLLLGLPAEAFDVIVVALIIIALVLVIVQPRLQKWIRARRAEEGTQPPHGGPLLWVGVLLAGMYGGYFGAAQGIILIALLGIMLDDDLQRLNAGKNVLSAVVNGTAAILFTLTWLFGDTEINWWAVLLIAAGSTCGGAIGASVGRRIPPMVLRGVIVVVGLVAIVNLLA
ncbi:sulfite exporter TauE/SafE family protein [Actinomadura darangshiensis]|uniref:Probable membrane transporter protein n=1 Tax=Actinomadura darangshiensis TaxID=705336 RepID=A0A4R5A9H4_9ACTN|nr:sulfite exporter TauE/SafE family protein [Actinomadura darangshiensis]TDD68275.1 sulfite exporter TauE/SafE family protein [Actinomadura darangshiensis]